MTETIKEEPVGAGAEATSKKAAKKAAKDAEKAAKVGNGLAVLAHLAGNVAPALHHCRLIASAHVIISNTQHALRTTFHKSSI